MIATSTSQLGVFRTEVDGLRAYHAGLPSYPHNFSRDVLMAGIIATDTDMLVSQLEISRRYQGTTYDPVNGEEPGKIHHQLPGVEWRPGLLTTYNACDTTSLYLIARELLEKLDPATYPITNGEVGSLKAAVGYLQRHVRDDMFLEFPPPGADRYCLRVTYWKDSQLLNAVRDEPTYPAGYALAQFQAALALEAASRLLNDTSLAGLAERMFRKGITEYMKPELFVSQFDPEMISVAASSDELHALAYIPTRYYDLIPWTGLMARAKSLETVAGFSCTTAAASAQIADTYHGYVVWPMEQTFIHHGLRKFGFAQEARIAERVIPYIEDGNEVLAVEPQVRSVGNPRQLWSVAAGMYFSSGKVLALE